jgi:ankyrin repeat protein
MKTTINNNLKQVVVLFTVCIFTVSCAQNKTESPYEATVEITSEVAVPDMDIHSAVLSGNLEIVKQHIAAGTDLNVKEPMGGSTPLMTAITFDKPKITQALIKAGSDLSITNKDGGTALHNAAFFGKVEMVQMLIDAKADKTIKNNYGMTARDLVTADYKDMKPVYDMLILQLQPMGFTLNLDELQKARPVIAMMLE